MWEVELRHKSEISLARQIFLHFSERILAGRLARGEALPSTRELAKSLGVSRNTVCEAYDMLLTEGFIVSHQGAPTRVAEDLFIEHRGIALQKAPAAATKSSETRIVWDFKTGQPDLSRFPWQLWTQTMREAADRLPMHELGYSGAQGYKPLCAEIADWLLRSRGITVEPQDVFITAGATQALHLLVDLLHRPGCSFALENPSHPAIHTVITDKGYPFEWMPVDAQGAEIESLAGKRISAVYVTPSHQFPLGGILPAGRRAALIRLAEANDFYIIEDDYDSEFRYSGAPVSPIYAMDSARVIYIGSFSKTLFPALRIGFAVLPKPLQGQWKRRRNYMDVQNPIVEQATLAEFLRKRKMDKHVQRMRRIYSEKRKILLSSLEDAFDGSLSPWGDASGLHVALQFPGAVFGEQFVQDSAIIGLRINPLAHYCPTPDKHHDKLLMGYGHLSQAQIQEGVQALHQLMLRGA